METGTNSGSDNELQVAQNKYKSALQDWRINYRKYVESEVMNAVMDHPLSTELVSERRVNLGESLAEFILDAIHKYMVGQQEHGGDIKDAQLDKEIRAEITDLFIYNAASKWPQLTLEQRSQIKTTRK